MHVQLLGPIVPGTIVPNGAHVPGTCHVLDPVAAAFSMGTAAAWLDFNDAWLAAEWCGGEGGTGLIRGERMLVCVGGRGQG